MNMSTISVNAKVYQDALLYAQAHDTSINELVENYLKTLVVVKPTPKKKELPASFKKLKGILSNVSDPNDERLNYLFSK